MYPSLLAGHLQLPQGEEDTYVPPHAWAFEQDREGVLPFSQAVDLPAGQTRRHVLARPMDTGVVQEVVSLRVAKDFLELTVACGGMVVFSCDAAFCRLLPGSTLEIMKFLRHLPAGEIELTYTSEKDLRMEERRRLWVRPVAVGCNIMAFKFLQLNPGFSGQGLSGRLELYHVGHGLILSVSEPIAAVTLQVDDMTFRVPVGQCCNQAAPVRMKDGYYIPLAGRINFSRHEMIAFTLDLQEQKTTDVQWRIWYVNDNFLQFGSAGQLAPRFAS